jgi:hypothetical protein
MAQHIVESFGGNIKEVTAAEDVAYMYLLYITYNVTKLPYEVEKSLVEVLFENKDKETPTLRGIIISFYSQKGYTVEKTEWLDDLGAFNIVLSINNITSNLLISLI